jgi:hypothetical protein
MTQGKRKASTAAPRTNKGTRAAARDDATKTRAKSRAPRSARSTQSTSARPAAQRRSRPARKTATKKIIEAGDVAMKTVTDAASEAGSQARRVASATAAFISANAVPLALLGVGTGWLVFAVQQRRRRNAAILNAALRDEPLPPYQAESRLLEQGREKLAALGSRAADGAQRVQDAAARVGDRAVQLGHDAVDGIVAAEQRAREFAKEHPVATSAAVAAAGVGIAMALPNSPLENRVLGPVRTKIEEEARTVFKDVKSGVQSALEAAVEVKNDLVGGAKR